MIHQIRTAWKRFDDCQIVANHLEFGGYWTRLSLTKSEQEFSALERKFPSDPTLKGMMLRSICEGVSWLRLMQQHADNSKTQQSDTVSTFAEHAIACFDIALEQYVFLQTGDDEAL
jgi:hypothetical protein